MSENQTQKPEALESPENPETQDISKTQGDLVAQETPKVQDVPKSQEIEELIHSSLPAKKLVEALSDYHDNDIAEAFENLRPDERQKLFKILGAERASDILPYMEEVGDFLSEFSPEQAADVLENMDADDAVDALEDMEDEAKREKLIELMDSEALEDVRLIRSYADDEVGSMMTTNFIVINSAYSVKQAMRSLISQSEDNDNINTIYVEDEDGKYAGAIDLRDLIRARDYTPLDDIISKSYPFVWGEAKISDSIEMLKDYAEDSIPVLNDAYEIIGVITSQDVVEAVDDELGEDYARLAGLSGEEDLDEKLSDSVKKRIPWLVMLLGLSFVTSTVIGLFEAIVAQAAILIIFQSLILSMAGNVGTQSLAVTIRVLMDEDVSGKEKLKFLLKEVKVGSTNGLILGAFAFVAVAVYLFALKGYAWSRAFTVSGVVGLALWIAMMVSGLIGTLVPMIFHKLNVDPAAASGPLITSISDLTAVVTYYGLAAAFLVR